jgi:hypothetical protein
MGHIEVQPGVLACLLIYSRIIGDSFPDLCSRNAFARAMQPAHAHAIVTMVDDTVKAALPSFLAVPEAQLHYFGAFKVKNVK